MSEPVIGDMIKKYRKQKRMTQRQLAGYLGVSDVVIGQYERGIRNPKIETVAKISDALGVTPFDIMGMTFFEAVLSKEEIQKLNGDFFESIYNELSDEEKEKLINIYQNQLRTYYSFYEYKLESFKTEYFNFLINIVSSVQNACCDVLTTPTDWRTKEQYLYNVQLNQEKCQEAVNVLFKLFDMKIREIEPLNDVRSVVRPAKEGEPE